MAYSEDLVRVRIGGRLNDGQEIFEMGFMLWRHHEVSSNVNWPADLQLLVTGLKSRFETEWPQIDQLFNTGTHFDWIKASHLDTEGHVLDQEQIALGSTVSGLVGLGSAGQLPTEVSMAVSLWGYTPGTFVTQRARKRGRFYLPPFTTSTMDALGQFSQGTRTTVSAWADTFFESVQGMNITSSPVGPDDHVDLVIASSIGGLKTQVSHIRVGSIPDVQRRRRNSLVEVYTDSVLSNH